MAEFKIGDRVRVKERAYWPSPPGYRLANSEGTVHKWANWDELFEDFTDYIYVILDKSEDKANIGKGIVFRAEDLEKS